MHKVAVGATIISFDNFMHINNTKGVVVFFLKKKKNYQKSMYYYNNHLKEVNIVSISQTLVTKVSTFKKVMI